MFTSMQLRKLNVFKYLTEYTPLTLPWVSKCMHVWEWVREGMAMRAGGLVVTFRVLADFAGREEENIRRYVCR